MGDIFNTENKVDTLQSLLWQYNKAQNLERLITAKQKWYEENHTRFWKDWERDVFNIDTANDFGLSVWGKILNFPRHIVSKNNTIHQLTTEQYRLLLKGQILRFKMNGSIPALNAWLKVVFGNYGKAYSLDFFDMSFVPFVLEFAPPQEILWLLENTDFIPRPAGVGYKIRIVGDKIFGFNGSQMQTFNNGTFYKNFDEELPDYGDTYQLTINCALPGVEISINGISGSYQAMDEDTQYRWEIKKDGYITLTGSGVITQDVTINIAYLTLNVLPSYAISTINGQEAIGAFFIRGSQFSYNYEVKSPGFKTQAASGATAQTQTLDITLETIYTKEESVYEQTVPGVYDILLSSPGFYEVSLVGAGGGGAWTTGVYISLIFWTGAGGGGGAAFKGLYQLPAMQTYKVIVGKGGKNGVKQDLAEAGSLSSFGELVETLGGKEAYAAWSATRAGVGGKINIISAPHSSSLSSKGNDGTGNNGGASLLSGYGAGGSYLPRETSTRGTDGYIKIVYKGLTL